MKSKQNKGPIKVGLAGLGRAGMNMHLPDIEKHKGKFVIVAACDLEEDFRKKFSEKYPEARVYNDFDEMLPDEDIELFDIATRTTQHFDFATRALKTGKDVFLEKPICTNFAEAKKLMAAADKAKGTLYIRHNRRFESGFVHIRQIIDSGILGDVFEIKLSRHSYQRRDDWQAIVNCGGGQLLNWGPHIIDHGLRFIDGKLKGLWSNLKRVTALGDAEDTLKIIMEGETGRIVDIEISGGVALGSPIAVVYGTRGSLVQDGGNLKLKYLDPRQKLKNRKANPGTPKTTAFGNTEVLKWIEKEIPIAPKPYVDTSSIWDFLYDSIRKGKPYPITHEQALQVMEVISRIKKHTCFEMIKH